jgi:hypothetical protein
MIVFGSATPRWTNAAMGQGAELPPVGAVPNPSDCTVSPRPPEDFTKPSKPSDMRPDTIRYEELPKGQAVDSSTLAEIQELDWQLAACMNAHDFERVTALYTDELLSSILNSITAEGVEWWREPSTGTEGFYTSVREVVRLTGGQLAALAGICVFPPEFAEFELSPTLVLYEQEDGYWRIAATIEVEREDEWCEPTYGPDDSLIDPAYWDEVFGDGDG